MPLPRLRKMLQGIATKITLQVRRHVYPKFHVFYCIADQNFAFLPTTDDKPGYINASFVDVSLISIVLLYL